MAYGLLIILAVVLAIVTALATVILAGKARRPAGKVDPERAPQPPG
jgi:hypothetical protein